MSEEVRRKEKKRNLPKLYDLHCRKSYAQKSNLRVLAIQNVN